MAWATRFTSPLRSIPCPAWLLRLLVPPGLRPRAICIHQDKIEFYYYLFIFYFFPCTIQSRSPGIKRRHVKGIKQLLQHRFPTPRSYDLWWRTLRCPRSIFRPTKEVWILLGILSEPLGLLTHNPGTDHTLGFPRCLTRVPKVLWLSSYPRVSFWISNRTPAILGA